MKYPKHILLDVATPTQTSTIYTSWRRYDPSSLISVPYATKNRTSIQTKLTSYSAPSKSYPVTTSALRFESSPTTLFDINFLRKEKLYTKLKYSRCPQYDIVSGGFAALLAGFIGFLISEKFGIELVDSGDFYIVFMYAVFLVFSLRPLLLSYSKHETPYNPISLKYLFTFITDITILFLRFLKSFLRGTN